jgi:hypothetical protein
LVALIAVAALLGAGCDAQVTGRALTPAQTPASVPAARPSSAPTSAPTSASSSAAAVTLIDHVHWGTTDKGRQLQVYPTPAGRAAPAAASAQAWAEVLDDAPTANTAGMYDQFLCHWTFARAVDPDKPSWDLEPWRPDVGYPATVAAGCNPGGPGE